MAIPGRKKMSNSTLLPSKTSLASMECLTMPLVHEVVLLADFRCAKCQKRVADIISRMKGEPESMEVSVLEKKVTLTFRSVKASPWQPAAMHRKPLNKVATISV